MHTHISQHTCMHIYYLPAKWRVEAPLVVSFGADDAGEQHPTCAVTHVTWLDLGVVDKAFLAIPISLGNAR